MKKLYVKKALVICVIATLILALTGCDFYDTYSQWVYNQFNLYTEALDSGSENPEEALENEEIIQDDFEEETEPEQLNYPPQPQYREQTAPPTPQQTTSLPVTPPNPQLLQFSGYKVAENSEQKKYEIADSFELGDGKYYYLFYLGMIDAAPIALDSTNGIYYNGMNTTLDFTLFQGTEQSITKQVKKILSNTVTDKVKASASVSLYSVIKLGVESEVTESTTESFEDSVTRVSKEASSFTQTISYMFSSNTNPVGYYCYTTLASMKIYEAVVYNPLTGEIENATPYSIIGKALPGLAYSSNSFFEYDSNKIEFDPQKVPSFEKPKKLLNSKKEVEFQAEGGSCEESKRTYSLGETFGTLPTPERHGFIFDGWYQNGNKVEEDSLMISGDPLVASWTPVTTQVYTASYISVQNGFGTSQQAEAARVNVPLFQSFDISYLKENGYRMKMKITYTVDFAAKVLGLSQQYALEFRNGSTAVYSVTDKFSKKATREWVPNALSPEQYDSTMTWVLLPGKLFEGGIEGTEITNFRMEVEFVK